MWTHWHSPSAVTQLETDQIPYTDGFGALDNPQLLTSVSPVVGNSRTGGVIVTTQPNSVLYSGFGFGIGSVVPQQAEIRLLVSRLSRIQDKTIQLYYLGTQGENLADLLAEDSHVYNTVAPSAIDYNSSSFGCVIDLAPHRYYPSNNTIVIRDVSVRLLLS